MLDTVCKHLVLVFLLASPLLIGETHDGVVDTLSTPDHPIDGTNHGLNFKCTKEEIKLLEREFGNIFKGYGWTPKQAILKTGADGEHLNVHLNSPFNETSTLELKNRKDLKIIDNTAIFYRKDGEPEAYPIVSDKEIMAAMLQRGRLFEYNGAYCSIEKFLEQIAIRRNIVLWGIRAFWKFPDGTSEKPNPVNWRKKWRTRDGVPITGAIDDAFSGKFPYEIGCTKACQLIMAQGVLDYFKSVKKDQKMSGFLESTLTTFPLDRVEPKGSSEGTLLTRHFDVPSDNWVPGDWGWIKNVDRESADEYGFEGSNIIYIGRGNFVVYYDADQDRTLDQVVYRVYGWRKDEKEEPRSDELIKLLKKDPRSGGLLRDVRDFPKNFQGKELEQFTLHNP